MNIYLYSDIASNGAKDLAAALGATRLRKFDGLDFWRRLKGEKYKKVKLNPDDVIICWGRLLPELGDIRVLNTGQNQNKAQDQWNLVNAGIPTITSSDKPNPGFLPRSKYHVGGNDLLKPPMRPDFWVKQEKLVKEYRIHSFGQRSIRAGVKEPREGFVIAPTVNEFRLGVNAHPWIRSYDAGWRINYDDFQSTKDLREIAHKAVKALGLEFGAVDLGEREDGKRIVLEVNKAPGLEGGTIEAYKRAIEKWIGDKPEVKKEEAKTSAEVVAPPYRNPLDDREARYGRPRWDRPAPAAGVPGIEIQDIGGVRMYRNGPGQDWRPVPQDILDAADRQVNGQARPAIQVHPIALDPAPIQEEFWRAGVIEPGPWVGAEDNGPAPAQVRPIAPPVRPAAQPIRPGGGVNARPGFRAGVIRNVPPVRPARQVGIDEILRNQARARAAGNPFLNDIDV